jgi:polysaccharide biosynthesis protein PslH
VRILACVHEAPAEPLNGFGLQVVELFDRLARRHEVRTIAYPPSYGRPVERSYLSHVARPQGTTRWLFGGEPRGASGLAAGMREPLHAALRDWRPDVVHVSSGRLAGLGRELGGTPSLLAALDAWHLNLAAKAAVASPVRRALSVVEERRVRRFVAREYPVFDRVTVVSEDDGAALRALAPSLDPVAIPNGVDAEAFSPGEPSEREPGAVVFTGAMDYAPNEAAAAFLARAVMPAVWERSPAARLWLVGRAPSAAVTALGSDERVTVTGEVPAVQPWLRRAAVYACPMVSGTGIKNKLLEALACAAPTVCTPLACRGLAAVPGEHLVVADDAASLAGEIVRLLEDRTTAERLGAGGRAYVLANHTWEAAARRYEEVYESVRR